MRKPPLARCMSFFFAVFVGTQPLSGGETAITAQKSVSDKMYFNQKIIVINNRWGEARWWRLFFEHKQRVFIFHVVKPNCCYFCGPLNGRGLCEFGGGLLELRLT